MSYFLCQGIVPHLLGKGKSILLAWNVWLMVRFTDCPCHCPPRLPVMPLALRLRATAAADIPLTSICQSIQSMWSKFEPKPSNGSRGISVHGQKTVPRRRINPRLGKSKTGEHQIRRIAKPPSINQEKRPQNLLVGGL